VFYAQEEAQKFGEGYVSTEHLLLGLVKEDSVAVRVLERLGANRSRIRTEVEKQLPRGEPRIDRDMTLTPRGKRVIDLAYDEARRIRNNYIGTEHLLLGLIRESDGLAGRVLCKLGVELEPARQAVLDMQDPERGAGGDPLPDPAVPRDPAIRPHWKDFASSIYLVQHPGTRVGITLLACLKDSSKLQEVMQSSGLDPEEVLGRGGSHLLDILSKNAEPPFNLNDVLRAARDLSEKLGSPHMDAGFLFLAGVQLDQNLAAAVSIPGNAIEELAKKLVEILSAENSNP